MDIENLRRLTAGRRIQWSTHALKRMEQRNVSIAECLHCLAKGELIEDYPTDYPFPSCLLLEAEKPLHMVCSIGDDEIIVITVYIPNDDEWQDDFKRRRT